MGEEVLQKEAAVMRRHRGPIPDMCTREQAVQAGCGRWAHGRGRCPLVLPREVGGRWRAVLHQVALLLGPPEGRWLCGVDE